MAPTPDISYASPLFARLASTADIDCPRPQPDEHGDPLFGPGSINFRQLMIYVSWPCLFVTVISCWFLSWRHLHRYTSPQEQRQILRIINLPIAYSVFNALAITFVADYMYIEPIGAIYEAFVVAALFFLVLEWVCPDGTDRETYFANLEGRSRRGKPLPGGSLKWFQRTWQSVLQYPLLKTIIIIIQIITQYFGDYCESSFSPKHAHLYLLLADYLFVGGALMATIRFFRRLRNEVAPIHKPLAKIRSFIGIIIFQIIQGLIFHLMNGKLFSPSATATYNDINFGIASFMTCIEAVVFSLIFLWAFSSSEYKEGQKMDRLGMAPAQRIGTFRAILDALNMSDIISGTVVALQLLFGRVSSRYGARSAGKPPQRQKTLRAEDQMHLEPMSRQPRNTRGYDYDMPQQEVQELSQQGQMSQYGSYSPPPMPAAARDPSPGAMQGKTRTWRADEELRPGISRQDSYARRGYRGDSPPETMPLQQQPRPGF